MNSNEFFAAVVKMRNEQKRLDVQTVIEKLSSLNAQLESEKLVDDEIERVEKLYNDNGLEKFW